MSRCSSDTGVNLDNVAKNKIKMYMWVWLAKKRREERILDKGLIPSGKNMSTISPILRKNKILKLKEILILTSEGGGL